MKFIKSIKFPNSLLGSKTMIWHQRFQMILLSTKSHVRKVVVAPEEILTEERETIM